MKSLVRRSIQRAARIAAQEFVAELSRSGVVFGSQELSAAPQTSPQPEPVRIDVEDALRQLSSNVSKARLNHFYTWNHRWVALLAERNRRTAVSTYDFIDAEMPEAVFRMDQFELVASRASEIMELGGAILDLGVYKGASTRALCRIFPDVIIHGFDSFEGLPGDWSHVLKGDFGDVEGRLPDVPDNAVLHKGWFDDTLPVWVDSHGDGPISLLRVDCDIYSSTKTIFDTVGHLLVPGTWVVFDELVGYRGWEHHEHRAFTEFMATRPDLDVHYEGYGLTYVMARLVAGSSS
jgi:hypothetical protein